MDLFFAHPPFPDCGSGPTVLSTACRLDRGLARAGRVGDVRVHGPARVAMRPLSCFIVLLSSGTATCASPPGDQRAHRGHRGVGDGRVRPPRIGVSLPTPTWGNVLQDARALLTRQPWAAVGPGVALATATLSLQLLADGLRDAFDPQQG